MSTCLKIILWPFDRSLACFGLVFVGMYRCFFSKRKGYSCTHNAVHGKGSCSDIAIELLKNRPFFEALRQIRIQIRSCNETHAAIRRDVFDSANKSLNAVGILVVTGAIAGCSWDNKDGGGEGPFGRNMPSIDESQELLADHQDVNTGTTDITKG